MGVTRIEILPDAESLAHHAAGTFAATAAAAVDARGRFLAVLSGGGTPQRLYELLAAEPFSRRVPWASTHLFWSDERCVPIDAPGSNFGQVRDTLLRHVPLPAANVHRIRGELAPDAAAAAYARELADAAPHGRAWPRLDLVLLGMGADGHTASLFPGGAALAERMAPALAVTADYDGRPARRVTLTLPVLEDGRLVLFLVSGDGKAAMVAHIFGAPAATESVPAARVRPRAGALRWLLDEEAAAALPASLPRGVALARPGQP